MSKTIANILIAITIASVAAFVGIAQFRKSGLNASSEEFAIEKTLAILEGSAGGLATDDGPPPTLTPEASAQILIDNADESLLLSETATSLTNELLSDFDILGSLLSMDSIRGEAVTPWPIFGPETISASYEIEAAFSGASATIRIVLLSKQQRWWISEFEIASEMIDS